jgi:hypothetical protein
MTFFGASLFPECTSLEDFNFKYFNFHDPDWMFLIWSVGFTRQLRVAPLTAFRYQYNFLRICGKE